MGARAQASVHVEPAFVEVARHMHEHALLPRMRIAFRHSPAAISRTDDERLAMVLLEPSNRRTPSPRRVAPPTCGGAA